MNNSSNKQTPNESRNKYTVIYSFKVIDDKESEFVESWTELTKLIYEFEGSFGSRLHKINKNHFIGYAQWPDKETFDGSGNSLPEEANNLRAKMRECCSLVKPEFEMETVIIDLLKNQQHPNYIN